MTGTGCHVWCVVFADHPGLPQTFTALPKVMPMSKGICKPSCIKPTAPGVVPVAGKVPESVQRWAELCGAHFRAAMEPGTPSYDPDFDPVVQVWTLAPSEHVRLDSVLWLP
jgi:hypothetical protein